MNINVQIDKRLIGSHSTKSEAFRTALVDALNHRFSGELPDAMGKQLKQLTVEVGEYAYTNVESTTANTELVQQVVNDVVRTTVSSQGWKS
ncbi:MULTISPECIES: hypothetical protein [Providencia]|uniref:Uncharacterized protein n=1 Tax=Providencia sneebia DSM 19967 TaxID=1141660 RepID=K8WYM4_9GAMM|nr:hypothetical protein [Providencia sneebia]EKT61315.1 hypothetical protein OO7_01381 [Providencia sneebia DSM 19967]